MGTYYLGTSRYTRNPVRVPLWNVSIRAGDDFKLAMTVFADDAGHPAVTAGSYSLLAMWRDGDCYPHSSDYGWGWFTGGSALAWAGSPQFQTAGYDISSVRMGGLNFSFPGTVTAGMFGRYRLAIMVDLPDGSFTQVEGIVQVRQHGWMKAPLLPHTSGVFFTLDVSQLDAAILAAIVVNSVPCDVDGFPLLQITALPGGVIVTGNGLSVAALTALLQELPTTLPATSGVLWMDGQILALS